MAKTFPLRIPFKSGIERVEEGKKVLCGIAGSIDNNKRGISEEAQVFLPGLYLKEGIGAEDKEEFELRSKRGMKYLQGFYGIGKSGLLPLNIPHLKERGNGACQPYHL